LVAVIAEEILWRQKVENQVVDQVESNEGWELLILLRPEDFTCLKTVLKNAEAFSPKAPLLLNINGTKEAFRAVREA
jgi:hypothetical protein